MNSVTIFTSLLVMLLSVKHGLLISQHPKLLVISYDAFRYDYFDRTPFMNKLKHEGTYADYMMNIFVTKTFPNHHTMATGLYAETHGVVDNEFYDPASGNTTKYSYNLYHYDNRILPIWTVNQKAGAQRRSGTMMWPGGIYEYQGISPTFAQNFNETVPWEERIDTLISWFVHPIHPINFGILYIEEPDYHGHVIGIKGPQFDDILRKLDNITRYLHNKIEYHGLHDLNVVHLSDHGMATVKLDRIIDLTKYINSTDYKFVGTSPGLHIFPNPGKEEIIYQKLKQAALKSKTFRVFKRNEIPKKYHYGNNTRVGPIFVIAEIGYAFQNLLDNIEYYKKKFNITVTSDSEFGLHGYDNEAIEMHPFFFANGPAFMPKCKLEPFNNLDLFPLFCKILDLQCPIGNGTISHLTKCLKKHQQDITVIAYRLIFVATTISMTLVVIIGAIIMFYMRKRQVGAKSYRRILEDLEAQYHWDENHDIENDTCKLNNFPDLFVISCYAKNRLSHAYKGNIKYRKTLFHCR
ncbi:bis(5'-adenosyl)-triphosphatase enpp4 isoform X1 [Bombus terrestris]|uniref:Bis(5'-adenosyl)-triphosphatase enpp4 isoform X1 n=1 Tax=Bombus terrestris TaxID=30195 RepID=A0A9C6W2E8_BOMTE|nr:bis(5'-adenosyl)-triphosphatase enpp4 isoform X1 [Bombus terrestris]XP_048261106.1 bis(5'-adenosyl)-triphosphatase enpp4 isoform X1 [Bombus terrestris]XP_048261107.1 bis(5'-adenosyl)-triphosphatase enpp4 isoform X1 [Bombus terrestris]XP_048261108.1 bis(5'-adenosyl)-triphosphatase enpp4 isoform X1 [Bombus terrestris]XP_048261109.1 bis(5'-adenosyl)-triphosphatase enpp4 isoform X1 [Bombus terrestris]